MTINDVMQPSKKNILWRSYLLYFLLCIFGIAILSKTVTIIIIEGEHWKSKAEEMTMAYRTIDAARGNIYAADESLLATSVPIYEVRMDLCADGLTKELFRKNIDSLSHCLAMLFGDKNAAQYKRDLITARRNKERFFLIKKDVRYKELKTLRTFPLFRQGRNKGGLIYLQQNRRERPFRLLAARTIGYEREGIRPIGLEGAYNRDLKGVSGKRLMQKIAGGIWMPLNDENEVEPENGCDLYTTIDLNIQDVAETALLKQLREHDADHGCVILMEVATGEIRAIANLSKDDNGNYCEYYNYAIGESTEPGSTFKLASLMAAIEDGLTDITDSVDIENGETRYFDKVMKDSHKSEVAKLTVMQVFEQSSNVGVSKVVNECYAKNPQAFITRLYKMGLSQPLGIEIYGEGAPEIKSPKDRSWSGTTLPWMSIGYELRLTPLQTLTFYNAVANDGKMVRPRFVRELKDKRNVLRRFDTEVISGSICSKTTIKKAQKMLEGVVESGTAKYLRNSIYKVAGKTGTAQIGYGDKTKKLTYQASFVGYFPAGRPKYSCIVVVTAPSKEMYYANIIACPVFKEVADRVYATSIDIHESLGVSHPALAPAPHSKNGNKRDLQKVFETLGVATAGHVTDSEWARVVAKESSVDINAAPISKNRIPDVTGMNAQDAVYLLENMGIHVSINGKGVVKSQSLPEGSKVIRGEKMVLELV